MRHTNQSIKVRIVEEDYSVTDNTVTGAHSRQRKSVSTLIR